MTIGNGVIQTQSGRYLDLLNPQPDQISIYDIAHALSHLCRFTGHVDRFYSVAEHSVRCASFLRKRGYTPHAQLAALMHDSAEAYIGDVSSPLKALLSDYRAIEARIIQAIVDKYGADHRGRPEVHMADMQMLCVERHELLTRDTSEWACLIGIDPADYQHTTLGWDSEKALRMFLRAHDQLVEECNELSPNGRNHV